MASTIRISILADAANAVRGLRSTGSAADRTSAELATLKRRVERLDGSDVTVRMRAEGFASGVGQIVVANLALDRIRKGLPDLSFGLNGVAGKFTLIAGAALAATAATLPLVGATVAIGAAFGAAAAGVGLFAAAAAPTFKTVTDAVTQYNTASEAYDRAKSVGDTKAMTTAQKNMASSLGQLTPLQRASANQIIIMNKAWAALSESTAPTVLGIISDAAGTLARIIPKITPAVEAIGKAISGISSTAFDGLEKSTAPFVTLVTTQGVPALKSLATIVGNILVTVGHLVTAFAPLGNVILARLTPLTAGLKLINFDALAKSAGALLPTVGSLLSNLGGAVGNLIKAAAPLAGVVLQALADIAGTLKTAFGGPEIKTFVANLGQIIPAIAPIVAVVVPAFLKFAEIISGELIPLVPKLLPIIAQMADVFVNVVAGLSPLLPALLGLIGVLVSFLPVLYPVITAFREAMIPVVTAVSAALVQLRPTFGLIVAAVVKLIGPISTLVVAFVRLAPTLIADLVPAFVAIADTVGQVLTALIPLFPLFVSLIPPITAIIVAVVKLAPVLIAALVPALIVVVGAVGQLLTAFTPLLPVLAQVITGLVSGLSPVIGALAGVLPTVVTAIGTLVPPLGLILTSVLPLLGPIGGLAAALITSLVPAVLSLTPILVTVANVIAKVLPVAIRILLPIITVLTNIVKSPAFPALAAIIGTIVVAIKSWGAVQAALTVVQVIFNAVLSANPIGLIVIAIAALVAGFVLAYKNSETFRNIVDGALRAVVTAFKFVVDKAKEAFTFLKTNFKTILAIVTGPIGLIILYVTTHWDKIRTTIVNGFNAVITFFTGIPDRFRTIGTNIINGLLRGIDAGIGFVRDKVRGLGALIPDWLKEVLGINSPSTETQDVAGFTVDGLIKGLEDKIPALKRSLTGIGGVITDGLAVSPTADLSGLSSNVTTAVNTGVAAAGAATINGAVPVTAGLGASAPAQLVVNVNVGPTSDPSETGRQVVLAIEAYERRTGRKLLVATP